MIPRSPSEMCSTVYIVHVLVAETLLGVSIFFMSDSVAIVEPQLAMWESDQSLCALCRF